MNNEIIDAIKSNPNFEICININLRIKDKYLKNMIYKYPYNKFSIDLLGKEYGKIYNDDVEFTYSLDEFEQYFDIYELSGLNEKILSINICDILKDKDCKNMYNVNEEIIKCKLTLQDIVYSDKIIWLEAEID